MKLEECKGMDIIFRKDDVVIYVEDNPVMESMQVGFGQSKGGIIKKSLQGFGRFANEHPWLTSALTLYAVDAALNYNKNKRKTVTLFSKNSEERTIYKDIVDTLMKTGKYRKEKNTAVDGGWLWVLKKVG